MDNLTRAIRRHDFNRVLQMVTESPNTDFTEALGEAIYSNDPEITRLLLTTENVNPQYRNNSYILIPSFLGYDGVMEALLADGRVDPRAQNSIALSTAISKGYVRITNDLLVDGRADPTVNNNSNLIVAIEKGYIGIVGLLLMDGRIDPGANNNQALKKAVAFLDIPMVRLLLDDPRLDLSRGGIDSLIIAFELEDLEIINLLLNKGGINFSGRDNALIRAALEMGNFDLISRILEDPLVDPSDYEFWREVPGYERIMILLDKKKEIRNVENRIRDLENEHDYHLDSYASIYTGVEGSNSLGEDIFNVLLENSNKTLTQLKRHLIQLKNEEDEIKR